MVADILVLLLQSKLFVEGGVNKIRLTGGEPTLRRDIVDLTGQLNALPGLQAIGITTNGIALKRKLPDLQAQGNDSSSWHTVIFWASDMPCSRGQSIPLLASCSQTRSNRGCRQTCNQHISVMHITSTALHNAAKRAAHDCCPMQALLCMHQGCKEGSCICYDKLMCEQSSQDCLADLRLQPLCRAEPVEFESGHTQA